MPRRPVKTAFARPRRVVHSGASQTAGRATAIWKKDPRWPKHLAEYDEGGLCKVPSLEQIALSMRLIREAHETVRWEGSPLLKPESGEEEAED